MRQTRSVERAGDNVAITRVLPRWMTNFWGWPKVVELRRWIPRTKPDDSAVAIALGPVSSLVGIVLIEDMVNFGDLWTGELFSASGCIAWFLIIACVLSLGPTLYVSFGASPRSAVEPTTSAQGAGKSEPSAQVAVDNTPLSGLENSMKKHCREATNEGNASPWLVASITLFLVVYSGVIALIVESAPLWPLVALTGAYGVATALAVIAVGRYSMYEPKPVEIENMLTSYLAEAEEPVAYGRLRTKLERGTWRLSDIAEFVNTQRREMENLRRRISVPETSAAKRYSVCEPNSKRPSSTSAGNGGDDDILLSG